MKGCNSLTDRQMTKGELDLLIGIEAGSFILWRNEFCVVECVNPLKITPYWDIE